MWPVLNIVTKGKRPSDIQTEMCVISGVFSERIQDWQVDVSSGPDGNTEPDAGIPV